MDSMETKQQNAVVPNHLVQWFDEHPPVLNEKQREALTDETSKTELDFYRLSLRRFDPRTHGLPWAMQAQCPKCSEIVPAEFQKINDQVVLVFDCPKDGRIKQVHYDNIFIPDPQGLKTYGGKSIEPILPMLPRTVETLCPECSAVILGRYYVHNSSVWIEKTCPDHGYFRDCINRDVEHYSKMAWMGYDEPRGVMKPHVKNAKRCPSDCGLCDQHQSPSILANIDLTNRCNLNCPVCFANANVAGYVYEPTFDEIVVMLQRLRDYRPIPCTCVQFSGGEPTIHPDFFKIVAKARDMGFSQIQIATNGIKMADEEFARQASEAGLHTLYLQFDGVEDDVYMKTRGKPLMKYKMATIENCRKFGMKVCLVPTIIRGENDDQVGKILHFAVDNIDTVSGISYQPVSFTGRIDMHELDQKRYTVGDLAHDLAKACGADPIRDFFPLNFTVPFSEIISVICGAPKIQTPCHPDCANGTYFWVSPDKKLYPFPLVFDIEPLFGELHRLAKKIETRGQKAGLFDKLKIAWLFYKHFRPDRAPKDLTFYRMVRSLQGMINKNVGRGSNAKTYKTLLAAGMHFQDRYNFDVQRIKRCVIHYSTPEGIFPFCTYNCGPSFRPFVEKMHARKSNLEVKNAPPDVQNTNLAQMMETTPND
ncbi:MAG: radical SAM protein [Phycisphaerae bacterium]|nr:radical SAM protein [Phycisphaerae bacterium]